MPQVKLAPLSERNIGQLVAVGPRSVTPFRFVPTDAESGQVLLNHVNGQRRNRRGDDFLAYEKKWRGPLVGGASYEVRDDRLTLAEWVVLEHRGRGFGRAILAAIEARAASDFPEAEMFQVEILEENIASLGLAAAAGYRDTGYRDRTNHMIFEKPVPTL
jgi:RimJ/RimL family protein N-acetyltransferase